MSNDDAAVGVRISYGAYLKKHTEALIKDLGYEKACAVSGKSKATLGRYFSSAPEHSERYMPIDVVAALEEEASFPYVTKALAELRNMIVEYDAARDPAVEGGLNSDIVLLSQRFATLMAEYNDAIADNIISLNEAKRLLYETTEIQQVLLDMKLHLEQESNK
jgi:hypothetical protein